jgi:PAS domain S-box-containing protein
MGEEHDTPTRILSALRFRPKGMTITEVAKTVGATRNSVSKHLEILQIAGKVEVRHIGNAKLYSLAQRVPMSAFLCFTRNLILILDSGLRIVQANDQCLKLLRRTKDDLIGLTLQEAALPVVSTPEAIAVIDGLEREQIISELRYRSEGKDLFYQMQAIPTTFDGGEKGCTLVLEDITERKRYVRNMEFLARTAMELVDLPAEADIFQYIAEQIRTLLPGARVYINSYDEVTHQFVIRGIVDEDFREGLNELLGEDIVGKMIRVSDLFEAPYHETLASIFQSAEFVFRPESEAEGIGFYEVCFRQIPEEVCDAILDRFDIGKFFGTGLVWEGCLFGIVGIFLKPHEVLEDKQAVESFLRQASIALARRQSEDRLRRSERRFRELVDFSPYAAAVIDADGRYTFLNRRFTELFGYTPDDIPTGRAWFKKAFPDENGRREAIAAWKADLDQAKMGRLRPRTFSVRCKDGMEKAILFRPVELCDRTLYVTYQDVTEERRKYRALIEEIAELQRQRYSPSM